jgi:hypothetical protein
MSLPSQHHYSTDLPSPKRYDNRYEAATYGSISPRLGDVEKPTVDHQGLLHSAYLAYLWAIKRADERTRTAVLLITSALLAIYVQSNGFLVELRPSLPNASTEATLN